MHLTRYTDYALRVLIYVGLRDRQLATIKDVAEHYGISRNHLMKVVHRLGAQGFIETVRGKKGGFRLGRPAREICVGDVVRCTEEDFNIVQCFESGRDRCRIESACVLQEALHEALAAFLAVLDRYTLADLLANQGQLSALLAGYPGSAPPRGPAARSKAGP
ncbi:MAG TPA: Rrf2 family transcriptional regulator [Gammaproteobacteria bacterium]|nr:Rrf2 family transcriptional regulator [Gammaproteobacteria bacterium]